MSLLKKIEEKKKEQERIAKKKTAAVATTSLAVGTLVGSVAGVLLAPKSGKETITDIKESSQKVMDRIDEKTEISKKITDSKSKIKEYLNRHNAVDSNDFDAEPVLQLADSFETVVEEEISEEI